MTDREASEKKRSPGSFQVEVRGTRGENEFSRKNRRQFYTKSWSFRGALLVLLCNSTVGNWVQYGWDRISTLAEEALEILGGRDCDQQHEKLGKQEVEKKNVSWFYGIGFA